MAPFLDFFVTYPAIDAASGDNLTARDAGATHTGEDANAVCDLELAARDVQSAILGMAHAAGDVIRCLDTADHGAAGDIDGGSATVIAVFLCAVSAYYGSLE